VIDSQRGRLRDATAQYTIVLTDPVSLLSTVETISFETTINVAKR